MMRRDLNYNLSSSTLLHHIGRPLDHQVTIYIKDVGLCLMVIKEEARATRHQMTIVIIDLHHTNPKGRNRMVHKHKLDNQKSNSLSRQILGGRIPRSLEKPLRLQNYDGKGDLNEHIKHIDIMLDYYHEP